MHRSMGYPMPKYDYRCSECNITFELEHAMEDTMELYPCVDETCEGYLHKVFKPAAVAFKGTGWGKVYRTYKPKG